MTLKAVRLHHPWARNCVFTFVDESTPYPEPYDCSAICKQVHFFKTVHLSINEHGDVCVAAEIYELMRQRGLAPALTATKEVTPAPTILTQGGPAYMGPVVAEDRGLVTRWNQPQVPQVLIASTFSMNGGRK